MKYDYTSYMHITMENPYGVWLVITAHINHPNIVIESGSEGNFCPRANVQLMVLYYTWNNTNNTSAGRRTSSTLNSVTTQSMLINKHQQ